MDAEIWSYADTRNGRLILRLLTVMIFMKEVAVMVLPLIGMAPVDPIWLEADGSGAIAPMRGLSALLVKFILVIFLYAGFRWPRPALGIAYVLTSAYAIMYGALNSSMQDGEISLPMIINGAFGLLIGAALLLSQQLKAHLWGKAASRLIIPIPSDEDEPPHRRPHGIAESIMIGIQRLVSFLILVAVLLLLAHLYGLTDPLLRSLGD